MTIFIKIMGFAMAMLAVSNSWANNLQLTNVTVRTRDSATAYIMFDISWENSWRYTNVNHDAAWVFFKVQREGAVSNTWSHLTLKGSGINPPGYLTGTGSGIELIVPDDRLGMFVRRSSEGSGTVSAQTIRAPWDMAENGLTPTNNVLVAALAIEMVYVAEGSFYVGDGTTNQIQGQFESGTGGQPFLIANEAYTITLGGGTPGSLGNNNATNMTTQDDFNDVTSRVLPVEFPKGYAAFYCMKYEITQGQYTDFLNLLTPAQAANRYHSGWSTYGLYGGYTIGTNTLGVFTNAAPDRACIFVSWADGCAFADWAGIRPMSELEFEKACRGPATPVTNEYAWGNFVKEQHKEFDGVNGSGTETALPVNANCSWNASEAGLPKPNMPVRVGIYATAGSTRESSGASYWGIMEFSGNVWERIVTIGNPTGRLFTGLHGDGVLTAAGNADVANWPGTNADGAGFRGGLWHGAWYVAYYFLRVSDRVWAARSVADWAGYSNAYGWRGVRTAPSDAGL